LTGRATTARWTAIRRGDAIHRSALAKISEEILADLEKETVDFIPNFDQTREEPVSYHQERQICW